jgi:hypothetical protein
MKKVLLLAIAILSTGCAFATPQFKRLTNKHGKTTIVLEIPAEDKSANNSIRIDNILLYNCGERLTAKKVSAVWDETSTIVLQFKKQAYFDGCELSFTLNGDPITINVQDALSNK